MIRLEYKENFVSSFRLLVATLFGMLSLLQFNEVKAFDLTLIKQAEAIKSCRRTFPEDALDNRDKTLTCPNNR